MIKLYYGVALDGCDPEIYKQELSKPEKMEKLGLKPGEVRPVYIIRPYHADIWEVDVYELHPNVQRDGFSGMGVTHNPVRSIEKALSVIEENRSNNVDEPLIVILGKSQYENKFREIAKHRGHELTNIGNINIY